MLACVMIVVGWLSVAIPGGFTAGEVTVENVTPMAGPPGQAAVPVWHVVMTGAAGAQVTVTAFEGIAPYPGGPMVVAETQTIATAAGPIDVHRTSMFMGVAGEVAVAYQAQNGGAGTAIIAVRGTDFASAAGLIATALDGCL
jgi:hypothetical protein